MSREFFINQREIDEWMTQETRVLTLPDGSSQTVTENRTTWRSFDFIVETGYFSHSRLIELVASHADYHHKPFEHDFAGLLAYIHCEIRRMWGID
jgi:hypothetical protein